MARFGPGSWTLKDGDGRGFSSSAIIPGLPGFWWRTSEDPELYISVGDMDSKIVEYYTNLKARKIYLEGLSAL